jgi:hypothetical protein
MAAWLSTFRAGRPLFPQGRFLVLITVRGYVETMAIVQLEGLVKLKISSDFIGNQIRDLPSCSIVPHPITLPRAPEVY